MKPLRVVRIEIRDVLGAEDLEIRPGRVTVLSGPNGSGKTTALRAVSQCLGRGSLASIARIGPDGQPGEPRVVLELHDDDGRCLVAERNGARVRLRERDQAGALRDVAQPQRALADLWDGAVANPVAMVRATPDERIRLLYEALPLSLDRGRVAEILQGLQVQQVPDGAQVHALEELAFLRAQIYEARKSTNRDAGAKRASAEQIRMAAPAEAEEGAAQELDALAAQASELRERISARAAQAREVEAAGERLARANMDRLIAEAKAELERRVADLRASCNDQIQVARAQRQMVDLALTSDRADLAHAEQAIAVRRQAQEQAAAAVALREQATVFERESEALRQQSERMTAALRALDDYARSLGWQLPAGLEVRGRELWIDGIPWDNQNTERQLRASVEVACLRAKASQLPLILVDGAEAFDPLHFDALVSMIEASGCQAIVACVSPTPGVEGLHVEAL